LSDLHNLPYPQIETREKAKARRALSVRLHTCAGPPSTDPASVEE
jgi:hypothetical protein